MKKAIVILMMLLSVTSFTSKAWTYDKEFAELRSQNTNKRIFLHKYNGNTELMIDAFGLKTDMGKGSILVKFGDGKYETYTIKYLEDCGEAAIAFIYPMNKFISKLKKYHTFTIKALYYENGKFHWVVMKFKTKKLLVWK